MNLVLGNWACPHPLSRISRVFWVGVRITLFPSSSLGADYCLSRRFCSMELGKKPVRKHGFQNNTGYPIKRRNKIKERRGRFCWGLYRHYRCYGKTDCDLYNIKILRR